MNANPIGIVDHDMFVVRKNGVIYRMIVVEVIASFRCNIQMFFENFREILSTRLPADKNDEFGSNEW